jgi:phosphatidylserine decarboxylase
MSVSLSNRLIVFLQRVIPARTIGRIIYKLSRNESRWFKDRFITSFCWLYSVNTTEAEKPIPSGYTHFNEFFTRKLKPGARPLDTQTNSCLSPADGTIAQLGYAQQDQLLQAKGMSFSVASLLGDTQMATELADCAYTTIYLAPYNYHRLHMPLAGTLEKTLFIPGLLYSVNARTAASVPNLYAVNERLVCQFNSTHGRFAMVLVGAMNVASISTAWDGEIIPSGDGNIIRTDFTDAATAPQLERGAYMGHFNMGSTIVLLAPPGKLDWETSLQTGDLIQMGQRIGKLTEHDAHQ